MNIKEALSYFKKQALFCPVMEVCGLLGKKDSSYCAKILKNTHQDPKNYFSIDPREYLKFIREYSLVAVFHSHYVGDSQPSDFDKANSESTLAPFLIYSLPEKKFSLYEPENHESDVTELKENL